MGTTFRWFSRCFQDPYAKPTLLLGADQGSELISDMIADAVPVGFVGLGDMGWPMARNLVRASCPLTVRDVRLDRQERFVAEHGCAGALSPAAFFGTSGHSIWLIVRPPGIGE